MDNAAVIVEDPFMDVDLRNLTTTEIYPDYERDTIHSILMVFDIITHITQFFLGVAGVSASIFLMHVIRRFKRLRTRSNFYIFNYAFMNVLFYIFMPAMEIILHLILNISYYRYHTLYCSVSGVEDTALFLCFTFALILLLDWYVASYNTLYIITYKKFYKWLIYIIYLIGLVRYVVDVSTCAGHFYIITHNFLLGLYAFALLILIVVNYLIRKKAAISNTEEEKKTKYCITIANFIFLSWLPLYTCHILYELFGNVYFIRMALQFTYFIPAWIATSNAIVVVYLLGRLNKYFKIAYKLSFKRSLKEYEHDGLDDSDSEPTVRHSVCNEGDNTEYNNERIMNV